MYLLFFLLLSGHLCERESDVMKLFRQIVEAMVVLISPIFSLLSFLLFSLFSSLSSLFSLFCSFHSNISVSCHSVTHSLLRSYPKDLYDNTIFPPPLSPLPSLFPFLSSLFSLLTSPYSLLFFLSSLSSLSSLISRSTCTQGVFQ